MDQACLAVADMCLNHDITVFMLLKLSLRITRLLCCECAAAQAGLIPPGPFGFGGGGFGGAGFGAPFMHFGMGPPGGGVYEQNGGYDASYSNGRTYGKDTSHIRRDKARGRHVPY